MATNAFNSMNLSGLRAEFSGADTFVHRQEFNQDGPILSGLSIGTEEPSILRVPGM